MDSDETLAAAYERGPYRGGDAYHHAQRDHQLERQSGASSSHGSAQGAGPDLLSFDEPEGQHSANTGWLVAESEPAQALLRLILVASWLGLKVLFCTGSESGRTDQSSREEHHEEHHEEKNDFIGDLLGNLDADLISLDGNDHR